MNSTLHAEASRLPASHLTPVLFDSTVAIFHDRPLPSNLRELIQPRQTLQQLLDSLLLANQLESAILVLAHSLPGRDGLLWCCIAIEELAGATLSRPERLAFDHCIRWVMTPMEPVRHLVAQLDESIQSTAVYSLCQAIRDGGVRIEEEHQHKPHTSKHGPRPSRLAEVIHRVTLAADLKEILPRQQISIAIGIGVARGIYRFAK
jgi:hypothetical protein